MNRRNFITDSIKAVAALTVAPLATILTKEKEPKKNDLKGWLRTIEDQCYTEICRYKYEYGKEMLHTYDAQRYLIKGKLI